MSYVVFTSTGSFTVPDPQAEPTEEDLQRGLWPAQVGDVIEFRGEYLPGQRMTVLTADTEKFSADFTLGAPWVNRHDPAWRIIERNGVRLYPETKPVEAPPKCAYAEMSLIEGVEPEPLDPFRGKFARLNDVQAPRPKYDAPVFTQEEQAAAHVIARAKRVIRSMPLCSITGLPVEIDSYVSDNCVQAVFVCRHCQGDA